MDETCPIEELLASPFKFRVFSEQLKLVQDGRPQPKMPPLMSAHGEGDSQLHEDKYDKVAWLTGSAKMGALFCWPCLLFSADTSTWNTVGQIDTNSYLRLAREHERTESHIRAFLQLRTFGSAEIDSTLSAIGAHNSTVQRNRDVLLRFLDCVFYVLKCGLPFDPVRYYDSDAEDEDGYILGRGNYLSTLDLLAEFDPLLKFHLNKASVFRERAVKIKDGLIGALATVVRRHVTKELESTHFAALLLDEIQTEDERLVCTFVRFVSPEGKVQERFVSARELDSNRNRDVVFAHISKVIDELGVADKLVSYSHCGRTVFASEMSALRDKIRAKCPRSVFVHDNSNDLQEVITGSLSHLRESRACVICLGCVPRFFSDSPERSESLRAFLEREYPDALTGDLIRRPLRATLALRKELLEYFDGLREESEDFRACSLAAGCVVTLESFEGCFHLAFLADMFAALEPIIRALETGGRVSRQQVDAACQELIGRADARFEAAWEYATVEAEEEPEPPRKRTGTTETNSRSAYRIRYNKCLQNAVAQIRCRLDARIGFLDLIDPLKFEEFSKEFPVASLRSADETYPGCFEVRQLRSELSALYSLEDARGTTSSSDLLLRMCSRGLDKVVPEAYRLGCLCLTVLGPRTNGDRLSRVRQCGDCCSDLATLAVETDLLMSLRDTPGFRDEVVQVFACEAEMSEFVFHTTATWTPDCAQRTTTPETPVRSPWASRDDTPSPPAIEYARTVPPPSPKRAAPLYTYVRPPQENVGRPRSPVSMVDIKEEEPFAHWVPAGELKMEIDDLSEGTTEFAFVEVNGDPLSIDDFKKE